MENLKNILTKLLALSAAGVLCINYTVFAAVEGTPAADTSATSEAVAAPEPTPEPLPDSYYWNIQTNDIAGWPTGPQIEAASAIVMDADYGTILYSKYIDQKRYPASITKIMTTLVALEHSSMDEVVTFSENAIYGIERDSSNIGIDVGEQLTMEQCLYAMMLASANEVCMGVAEHICGSTEAFVDLMNQKASELGCTNTHFSNTNGLPDENHYTTARDMALIAKAAYKNRTFRAITGTVEYVVPATNIWPEERYLYNHHKMLSDAGLYYEGCIGGKTGYTQTAQNTLVTYARRGDSTLICVNLKTNGTPVYTDTATLLDYGFENFTWKKIYNMTPVTINSHLLPSQSTLLSEDLTLYKSMRNYGWALVPNDVEITDLTMKKAMEPNVIGPWREITTYYYNDCEVGHSYKYELPVLSKLLRTSL